MAGLGTDGDPPSLAPLPLLHSPPLLHSYSLGAVAGSRADPESHVDRPHRAGRVARSRLPRHRRNRRAAPLRCKLAQSHYTHAQPLRAHIHTVPERHTHARTREHHAHMHTNCQWLPPTRRRFPPKALHTSDSSSPTRATQPHPLLHTTAPPQNPSEDIVFERALARPQPQYSSSARLRHPRSLPRDSPARAKPIHP
jgi:hypothetical protein